jgi:hypothetical protein
VRLLTGLGLLALGAWYDYHKLAPGPITLSVLVAYVLPPVVRAIAVHRAEVRVQLERQAQIAVLQHQMSQLSHAEISSLRIVAQQHISGVYPVAVLPPAHASETDRGHHE